MATPMQRSVMVGHLPEEPGSDIKSRSKNWGVEMLEAKSDYTSCVKNSEKIAWRLDDVLTEEQQLDFSRPFLPESLAQGNRIGFLSPTERLALNHITSNAYLNIFAFAEEYVLSLVVGQANTVREMDTEVDRLRALMRFVDEEAKHQQLFRRYLRMFARDFGHECGVLDNAKEVAEYIVSKHPIAVLLLTLHIELTTQKHYTESVKDDHRLDPLFASVLRYHWMEEAQHAQIDALELSKEVAKAKPEELDKAIDEYFELVDAFWGLLSQQATLDVDSLERAAGRVFAEAERREVVEVQTRIYGEMLLACGMLHRKFLKTCDEISPALTQRIYDWVASYFPEMVHAAA
jgi:hypothetical protein